MSGSTIRFEFEGDAWFYKNPNAVFFISLPTDISADILDLVGTSLNPWGTVPVMVTINDFSWETSMFPRPDRGCYDLPLNARARKRLGIGDGDLVSVTLLIAITL